MRDVRNELAPELLDARELAVAYALPVRREEYQEDARPAYERGQEEARPRARERS